MTNFSLCTVKANFINTNVCHREIIMQCVFHKKRDTEIPPAACLIGSNMEYDRSNIQNFIIGRRTEPRSFPNAIFPKFGFIWTIRFYAEISVQENAANGGNRAKNLSYFNLFGLPWQEFLNVDIFSPWRLFSPDSSKPK